ncbi:hypothetical protein DH2020_029097 [Rehmannia glutinosa]|uniref:PORR domain-containing protein n=1 Tax=Rehmannia glutinosa TaxID=99300 RepID=A0ABR0VT91_REHGL
MMFQQRRSWRSFDDVYSSIAYFHPFIEIQKRNLVNVKLKWVKDTVLDSAVSNGAQLKATCTLVSLIGSNPDYTLPVYCLSRYRGQLGLPSDLKVSSFIRRYPNIFQEFYRPDSRGTPVPWYSLTPETLDIYNQETRLVYEDCYEDILNRLQKLLMLTKERLLPLQTIDQLRWDLGLPYDYENKLVAKRPELFSFSQKSNLVENHGSLAFPIGFTRGFGLKKKCMEWLNEWQKLPYTSPYVDASHLDPRTDVSEKRIVGVFHELLHLTILRKMERRNVSNMRGRWPCLRSSLRCSIGIQGFLLIEEGGTQTVVLREAYDRGRLIEHHPLAGIRKNTRA